MQATRKYFNKLGCGGDVRVFRWKLENSRRYHSSNYKKIPVRVTQGTIRMEAPGNGLLPNNNNQVVEKGYYTVADPHVEIRGPWFCFACLSGFSSFCDSFNLNPK